MTIPFYYDYLNLSYKVIKFDIQKHILTMKINLITLMTTWLVFANTIEMNGQSKREKAIRNIQQPVALEEVQEYAIGEWESISVELRPTEDRTGSGTIQPTFLKRNFKYLSKERFVGTITMFVDNYGEIPLLEFEFKGEF